MNLTRDRAVLALAILGVAFPAYSQSTFYEHFRSHNAEMAALQPSLVTPLVAPDPRLIQYVRIAVSHNETASGTNVTNFGNGRGAGLIVGRRFEFDWLPPSYILHSAGAPDGAADTSLCAKARLVSGGARSGNFDIAALVSSSFPTGSHTNGARTGVFTPTIVGGYAFGRFDAIASVGGTLPTGKINAQGRSIVWNSVLQFRASRSVWLEIEDNASFYHAGEHDGERQNFLTPAAFYILRRPNWQPSHPIFVFASGMQIATSGFHPFDHNIVTEMRILF